MLGARHAVLSVSFALGVPRVEFGVVISGELGLLEAGRYWFVRDVGGEGTSAPLQGFTCPRVVGRGDGAEGLEVPKVHAGGAQAGGRGGVEGSAGGPGSWRQVVELEYPALPNLDAGGRDVAKGVNLRFRTLMLVHRGVMKSGAESFPEILLTG